MALSPLKQNQESDWCYVGNSLLLASTAVVFIAFKFCYSNTEDFVNNLQLWKELGWILCQKEIQSWWTSASRITWKHSRTCCQSPLVNWINNKPKACVKNQLSDQWEDYKSSLLCPNSSSVISVHPSQRRFCTDIEFYVALRVWVKGDCLSHAFFLNTFNISPYTQTHFVDLEP